MKIFTEPSESQVKQAIQDAVTARIECLELSLVEGSKDPSELVKKVKQYALALKILIRCIETSGRAGPNLLKSRDELLEGVINIIKNVKTLSSECENQALYALMQRNIDRVKGILQDIYVNRTCNFKLSRQTYYELQNIYNEKNSCKTIEKEDGDYISLTAYMQRGSIDGKSIPIKHPSIEELVSMLIDLGGNLTKDVQFSDSDKVQRSLHVKIVTNKILERIKVIDWEWRKYERKSSHSLELLSVTQLQNEFKAEDMYYNHAYVKQELISHLMKKRHNKNVFLDLYFPKAKHHLSMPPSIK